MNISVIIPVFDDADMLRRCLEHLFASDVQPAECIVVCDGAIEEPAEVARAAGATVLAVAERRGPAFARNLASSVASGDVLLFIDSDVCVHTDTVGRIAARFERDTTIAALFGSYDRAAGAPGFISQYKTLLQHYVHHNSAPEAATFWSGCGAIRSDVFRRLGGFDDSYERPAIEDIEMGVRLVRAGERIVLDASIQVTHWKRWSFGELVRTDVLRRAIPWAQLIVRSRRFPNQLNIERSQRWCVGLMGIAVLFLAGATQDLRAAGVAALAIAAAAALNWRFYAFLKAQRGVGFATAAVPLHLLYFLYSGVAFLFGAGRALLPAMRPEVDAARLNRTARERSRMFETAEAAGSMPVPAGRQLAVEPIRGGTLEARP
jgi:GT2 family glycosyltransferase